MNNKPAIHSIQELRERYIRQLEETTNATELARKIADDLFALDLTVYSHTYSLDSIVYSSFARSVLDSTISMHPQQIEILNKIESCEALIISAPTSFGKTFCLFEYIAKYLPQNIVLIVPTLALVDEYLKKIIKKYQATFSQYKIHTQVDEDRTYDFNSKNIFILTHDRVVQESAYDNFEHIDLLVIDEVYKLETDPANDRVLVLNMAYFHLAQKSSKYVLLAPFINNIEDIEKLDRQPEFFNSTYSPVINEVRTVDILRHSDRYVESARVIKELPEDDKTLIYFPTVMGIYKYINEVIINESQIENLGDSVKAFLEWAKEDIHEEWSVVKAMERGYLIHNGQIPIGTRLFQLDYFESSPTFNKMLCTSTLLEGVNTVAKNIVITKPSRMSDRDNNNQDFSAFDFFNLVGRTGRLNQHLIGTAYYIKAPSDPEFIKADAVKSIKFELTDDSKDIDIQTNNIDKHQDVLDFLSSLGITLSEYLTHIGSRPRFETVVSIYNRYVSNKNELIAILRFLSQNPQKGRLDLIKKLYFIIEGRENAFESNIVNQLINRQRPKIKSVVDNTRQFFSTRSIDNIISTTIKIKMSYIEHQFYPKIALIKFFMEKQSVSNELIKVLDDKVINAIEHVYFSSSKHRKMLIDLGIYERDIDLIIRVIGEDFGDSFELKARLRQNLHRLDAISFISKYVIQSMM